MLFGEHAVLRGKSALVCALDVGITVELIPRDDAIIGIYSALGDLHTTVQEIVPSPSFSFVTESICSYKEMLSSGFDLKIHSAFSHHMGLGSSSAVTVATCAALAKALGVEENLFERAFAVVRKVQGRGSGADVAASIFGGIVAYRCEPRTIEPLHVTVPITLLYSGSKRATVQVIEYVLRKEQKNPELYKDIFNLMEEVTCCAKKAICAQDLEQLGRLCNIFQGLMDAIGTNNAALSELVYTLRNDPAIFGSKISGSGLGDCVIGIGSSKLLANIPVQVSLRGVYDHEAVSG